MFAREHKQEYDPTLSPAIERPLASGRPLSVQVQGSGLSGRSFEGLRHQHASDEQHKSVQSPLRAAMQTNGILGGSASPDKGRISPIKSSLSTKSKYAHALNFDPESSIWDDDEDSIADRQLPPGKSLHRHAKSVTFDAAPPEVNEYEMTTPDPSSVASGSREGSHDSVNDEDDESFDRDSSVDRDDSFDASLEDTEKTPVVLPEDWRFMSPAVANEDLTAKVEDPFDHKVSSPSPTLRPQSAADADGKMTRSDSYASDGERRPLPPLPALGVSTSQEKQSKTHGGIAATVERSISPERRAVSPPRPASITKAELQGLGSCAMPIEDRLRLMMIQDDDAPKTATEAAEEQRERRLRRGSPIRSPEPEPDSNSIKAQEQENQHRDDADLDDYIMPPRISRESILRKVKGRSQQAEVDEQFSSTLLSPDPANGPLSQLDPDTPLPSTEVEVVETEVMIKQENNVEDSELDVYSTPDLYSSHLEAESYLNAIEKLEAIKQSRVNAELNGEDDDDESHYSIDSKAGGALDGKGNADVEDGRLATPRAGSPSQSRAALQRNESHRMSLPQFAALLGETDFGFGMESFMADNPQDDRGILKQGPAPSQSWSPSPPINREPVRDSYAERPITPEQQIQHRGVTEQEEEAGTPDSVIRHSFVESSAPDSPGVPEPVATIKSSGSKLKTRPSATPADIRAMAETRRQVSGEVPAVPAIPSRHLSRPSVVVEGNESFMNADRAEASVEAFVETSEESAVAGRQPKRKSSLIPLDLAVEDPEEQGLGIESEFDRVIEGQKVTFLSIHF